MRHSSRPNLIEEIPALEQLDEARQRLRRLRDESIDSLFPRSELSNNASWEKESDADSIEEIYVRRAKHLAFSLGRTSGFTGRSVPEWPDYSLESLYDRRSSDTPVFLAATLLRARIDDENPYLTRSTLACAHRCIFEVFSAHGPDWDLGGARAGGDSEYSSISSSFVTSEVARGLNGLRSLLLRTRKLMATIKRRYQYLQHVERCRGEGGNRSGIRLKSHWSDLEVERIGLAVGIDLEEARGRSYIIEGAPDEFTSAVVGKWIIDCVSTFTKRSLAEYQVVSSSARSVGGRLQEAALSEASSFLGDFAGALRYVESRTNAGSGSAVAAFDAADEALTLMVGSLDRTLSCVARYAESVMYRSLFRAGHDKVVADVPQLAFAACTFGFITGRWSDAALLEARDTLSGSMDEGGVFPAGRPFHLGSRSLQRSVINAHVVRALAVLIQQCPGEINEDALQKLIGFFEVSRVAASGIECAWTRLAPGRAGKPSKWVTAASLLAIDRLIRTINYKLNDCISRFFDCRSGQALDGAPDLDSLMASDVGLVAAKAKVREKEESGGDHLLTWKLEQMRAHLAGERVVRALKLPSVYSLILYGPPGTGKTTIAESVAKTAGRMMIQVTPADLVIEGLEGIERRAAAVMKALSLVTDALVLFDEFDSVLHSREEAATKSGSGPQASSMSFVTGNMLPRLAALHKSAAKNRVAYILATNYVERLDGAAVRPGRFDFRAGVYPPDAPSRLCRLLAQLDLWGSRSRSGYLPDPNDEKGWGQIALRIGEVIQKTGGLAAVELCKRGWLLAPKDNDLGPIDSPWGYILGRTDSSEWERRLPLPTVDANSHLLVESLKKSPHASTELVLRQWVNRELIGLWESRIQEAGAMTWDQMLEALSPEAENVEECISSSEALLQRIRERRLRGHIEIEDTPS